MDLVACAATAFILEGGVVLFRGVDVVMAEDIRHEVDVAGFLIEVRAIGGAQLMRCDMLRRCDGFRIFLYHVLDGADAHALHAEGEEEGVFMVGRRDLVLPPLDIRAERILDLVTEIDGDLLAALTMDVNAVVVEVDVVYIQAYAFRYTDASTEHQRHHSLITKLGLIMEGLLVAGELLAVFDLIEEIGDLVCIETDDVFFLQLWHLQEIRRVRLDQTVSV